MAKAVYNDQADGIPTDLFSFNAQSLISGTSEGFVINPGYEPEDINLLHELTHNVAVFSAFKAYRMTNELKTSLLNDDGTIKSFVQFKKDAEALSELYNTEWLRSEYNLAIRQGRAASLWNKFQQNKDVYPNLKYNPSLAAEQRDSHKQYYGMIKPIDDVIWTSVFPPNGWGCKCSVTQTREDVSSKEYEPLEKVPGISGNAGIDKQVFTNSHPYVKETKKTGTSDIKKAMPGLLNSLPDSYKKVKGKKGNVLVHDQADSNDLEANMISCMAVVNAYKDPIEIRKHSFQDGVKNPELKYRDVIGDRVEWKKASNAKNFVFKSWAKKAAKEGQFKDLDSYFFLLDVSKKIKASNIEDLMRAVNGKMNQSKRCEFVIIQNKNKLFIFNKADKYDLQKAKKALIE